MRKWMLISLVCLSLSGCASATNNNSLTTNSSQTTTDTSSSDASSYYNSVNALISQFNQQFKAYSDFIKDYNAGHYGVTQGINELGTLQTQLEGVKTKALTMQPPDSMASEHQVFVQAITDLMNSESAFEDSLLNSGNASKDIDNATRFMQNAGDGIQKYLSDLQSQIK
ncbi:hypothetical protein GCM10025857_14780 [Alicyclobacillus contaminans]|uniref:hypothetical protein n=1 Tax=Alicyclobacillus contaminans TaxID=392016 RepID=UPI0012EC6FC5|nr:hypothetical protein [Alicyclobacillus contaminans]GMA50121.1 hypothetical protein GCM10025857_14780 [Alicyclobacillus contaminans]